MKFDGFWWAILIVFKPPPCYNTKAASEGRNRAAKAEREGKRGKQGAGEANGNGRQGAGKSTLKTI